MPRAKRNHRRPIIGLTGGIGAGKSTVAAILRSLGAAVIDSDHLAHEVLDTAEVAGILCGWWGDGVLTRAGRVDRAAVARIVFEKPDELARLEDLLYPLIGCKREALMAGYERDPAVRAVVLEAPKLYEAGLAEACDTVIFVDADRAIRVERVRASRRWSEAEFTRREKLLQPLDKKRGFADYVVENNSSLECLRPVVERILSTVTASFS